MAERAALQEPLLPAGSDGSDDLELQCDDQHERPTAAGRLLPPPPCQPTPPGVVGKAAPLSSLAFSWVSPLLERGSTQGQLQQSDLFELPPHLLPSTCGRRLWSKWQAEQQRAATTGRGRSLLRAIVAAYGRPYFLLGLLKAASDALSFAGPMLLNLLLRHLGAAPPAGTADSAGASSATLSLLGWEIDVAAPAFGYACAALLAASLVLKAFLGAQYDYRRTIISSQLRSAVTAVVFRKALAVNAATLAATGSGRVQTLMSVDADRLVNLCLSFHDLWSLPAQIAIALWLLYTQVQYAFLAGLGLVLLLIPVNRVLANRIQAASVRMMGAKDRRVRAMMEILRGIRQIKAYAWERLFAARVERERRSELAALAVRKYLDALCVYFWAATNLLFSLATFGLYALMGRQLTPQVVFTSLALFNVLLAPINAFPWVINGVVEAVVSVRRLSDFLGCRETAGPSQSLLAGHGSRPANWAADGGVAGCRAPCAVDVGGSFSWGAAGSDGSSEGDQAVGKGCTQGVPVLPHPRNGPTLRDIKLSVPAGSLVAVTGPVGSGKSSLLAAVLGEMLPYEGIPPRQQGQQRQSGRSAGTAGAAGTAGGCLAGCLAPGCRVAYVAQDPWIPSGTVRDVVLFEAPLDPARYRAVLHACALLPDLQAWPAGDRTLVGGAGATLSGGQRARLALARALYHGADVLLLDDCLSAVDARVAAWILRHALLGPLLWVPPPAERQLEEPAGPAGGPPLQHRRQPPTLLVATHAPELLAAADLVVKMRDGTIASVRQQPQAAQHRARAAAAAAAAAEASSDSDTPAEGAAWSPAAGSAEHQQGKGSARCSDPAEAEAVAAEGQQGPARQEEERQLGHVRWEVYRRYAAATGWGWVAVILLSLVLMQATRNGNDLWLSRWVSHTAPAQPQQDGSSSWLAAGQLAAAPACSSAGLAAGALASAPAACMLPLAAPMLLTDSSSGSGHSGHSSGHSGGHSASLDPTVRFYLSILLFIAGANSLITLARAFSFAKGGLVAAKRVHEQLLSAVLALPLAFFDATPPGRVLNRFSSDTATVDDSLPFILNILLANCASLAGVAAVLCLTQPLVLVLLPPLALLYTQLQRYYRATSRELRRLEAVARSPVYTAFAEALSGGPTIRAFAAQHHILTAAEAVVAAQQRASVSSAAAGSWLALRLQLMAAALAAAVAGAAVAEHAGSLPWSPLADLPGAAAAEGEQGGGGGSLGSSSMTAGLVGLSLSYVLPITGLLSGLLTSSAETEQEMVAAERIFQFLQLGLGSSNSSSGSKHSSSGGTGDSPLPGAGVIIIISSSCCNKARSAAGTAAAAAGDPEEVRQPLLSPRLPQPPPQLLPPAAGSASGGWLRSGHVRFEDVWLWYEPWKAGGGRDGGTHGSLSGNGGSSGGSPPSAAAAGDQGAAAGDQPEGSSAPWVLRGVSLDIPPGSHVGICGRTGAGKSSLLAALLRLAPIAGGRITIDGRDISTLDPAALRQAVGVVPQHPFLFEGTVRENLDPHFRHSTAELAVALHQVALWQPLVSHALPADRLTGARAAGSEAAGTRGNSTGASAATGSSAAVAPLAAGSSGAAPEAPLPAQPAAGEDLEAGQAPQAQQAQQAQQHSMDPHHAEGHKCLEERVLSLRLGEGAAALSQGQQQLLALARVLLRRPRLLLLDEATSSVDPATADTMHQVIKRHLAGTTIIEVAHRQSTIAACGRVVVMEAGQVVQQG